jgi:hypothetical protein
MKTTNQIKAYILQCGHKRTNAYMAEKLGVTRTRFAGILAAMKRNGEIPENYLKTDVEGRKRVKA